MMNKKAQDEMVGFAVILVIVSVVLLVVLGFALRSPNESKLESYEVESFIEASLQYTTECKNYLGFMPVQDLIISCEAEGTCTDGKNSCDILNSTLDNLITKSWNVVQGSPVKGYELQIKSGDLERLDENNSKGDFQDFARKDKTYEISLVIYS
jgi:hypothetical protein